MLFLSFAGTEIGLRVDHVVGMLVFHVVCSLAGFKRCLIQKRSL